MKRRNAGAQDTQAQRETEMAFRTAERADETRKLVSPSENGIQARETEYKHQSIEDNAVDAADDDIIMVDENHHQREGKHNNGAEQQGENEEYDNEMSYDAVESRLGRVVDKIKQCEARIVGFKEITGAALEEHR
jgi:hypothetical protein